MKQGDGSSVTKKVLKKQENRPLVSKKQKSPCPFYLFLYITRVKGGENMAQAIMTDSKLRVSYETGLNEKGEPIFKSKTYANVIEDGNSRPTTPSSTGVSFTFQLSAKWSRKK